MGSIETRQNQQGQMTWLTGSVDGSTPAADQVPLAPTYDAWILSTCRPADRVQSGGFAVRVATAGDPGDSPDLRGVLKVVNIDPDTPDDNVDMTDELEVFNFDAHAPGGVVNPATGTILRLDRPLNGASSPAGDLIGLVYYETGSAGSATRPLLHLLGWPLVSVDKESF